MSATVDLGDSSRCCATAGWFEPGRGDRDRASARPTRCDGRHCRLLRFARARAADRRRHVCGVQPIDGAVLEVISIGRPPLSVPIATLIPDGEPIAYEVARRRFAAGRSALGGLRHRRVPRAGARARAPLDSGARVVIASTRTGRKRRAVRRPPSKRRVMQAAACAFDVAIQPRDLALLCQQAENLVAGAPCGVMDQMTCVFGRARRADGVVVSAG